MQVWFWTGTALATGGEDGALKIWSRSGIHRCTLAQHGRVLSICDNKYIPQNASGRR